MRVPSRRSSVAIGAVALAALSAVAFSLGAPDAGGGCGGGGEELAGDLEPPVNEDGGSGLTCEGVLGAAVAFEGGAIVPAVGEKARVLAELRRVDGPEHVVPEVASDSPALISVSGNEITFLGAGTARLRVTACGTELPVELRVVASVLETPLCREMTQGILEYARAHPACMAREDLVVPACSTETAAFEQAFKAVVECSGPCQAERQAAASARAALESCKGNVTAGGAACGPDYRGIVERCRAIAGSDCGEQAAIASACAGVR